MELTKKAGNKKEEVNGSYFIRIEVIRAENKRSVVSISFDDVYDYVLMSSVLRARKLGLTNVFGQSDSEKAAPLFEGFRNQAYKLLEIDAVNEQCQWKVLKVAAYKKKV